MKQCIKCNVIKEDSEFSKAAKYKDKIYYRNDCKECCKAYKRTEQQKEKQRKYRSSDEYKQKRKEYRKLPHIVEYEKQYELKRAKKQERKKSRYLYLKNRLENDPFFRLSHNLRNRLRSCIKSKKWKKNNEFAQYIGCSREELRSHIEKQFQPGMTWDNYGEWEIDHIIPVSSGKTLEELIKLNHYTNLQPLWWLDNNKKSNK